MALSTITNGLASSTARTRVNAVIDAVNNAGAATAVSYTTPLTENASTIVHDSVRTMTLSSGNLTLNGPTSPTAGQRIRYHLTASGATRTVTLGTVGADLIDVPTGVTFDGAIPSGSMRVIEIEYISSAWRLTRNLEFTL